MLIIYFMLFCSWETNEACKLQIGTKKLGARCHLELVRALNNNVMAGLHPRVNVLYVSFPHRVGPIGRLG